MLYRIAYFFLYRTDMKTDSTRYSSSSLFSNSETLNLDDIILNLKLLFPITAKKPQTCLNNGKINLTPTNQTAKG
ncbi:hypothetical protein VCV18_011287 [Metarhizium anisopliae]